MSASLHVFFQIIGKPFLMGLIVPVFALLITISFIDSNTQWSAVQARFAAMPVPQTTLIITFLVAGWCWMAGQALRPVWAQPTIRFLVRQPLSRWQWVKHVLPNTLVALMPVGAIVWLIHPQTSAWLHYVVLAGVGWPIILGASYRGRGLALLYIGGTLVFAAVLATYLYYSYLIYAGLTLLAVLLPAGVSPISRELLKVTRHGSSRLTDLSPVRAFIRRDLRCLLRLEWKHLVNLAVLSVLTPAMMLAFRINAVASGRYALLVAIVLFTIVASAAYDPLEKLKSQLGKEVFRLRWPVSARDRAYAMTGLAGLLLAPSAILIGIFGSTMGYANGLVFLLFCVATTTICLFLFTSSLGLKRSTTGQYYLALLAHTIVACLAPAWGYIVIAITLVAIGFHGTVKRLRGFAIATEIGP